MSSGTHPEELAPVELEDAKELPDVLDVAAAELLVALLEGGWPELVLVLVASEEAPALLDPTDVESAEELVMDVAPALEEATAEDGPSDEAAPDDDAPDDDVVDDDVVEVAPDDDEEAVVASAGMQVWAGPQV